MKFEKFHKVSSVLFWIAVALSAAWWASRSFLSSLDHTLLSQQTSPNGQFTIHEFMSLSDAFGHAPYGLILVLSPSRTVREPLQGHVFFGGYCSKLVYRWTSDQQIAVRCVTKAPVNPQLVRTLSTRVLGIAVQFAFSEHP